MRHRLWGSDPSPVSLSQECQHWCPALVAQLLRGFPWGAAPLPQLTGSSDSVNHICFARIGSDQKRTSASQTSLMSSFSLNWSLEPLVSSYLVLLCSETGSHCMAKTDFKSWSSCPSIWNAGIMDVWHHTLLFRGVQWRVKQKKTGGKEHRPRQVKRLIGLSFPCSPPCRVQHQILCLVLEALHCWVCVS